MHTTRTMRGLEPHRRAAIGAKVPRHTWRAVKLTRRSTGPPERADRHTQPRHNRRRAIPAAIVTMAITGSCLRTVEFPRRRTAKTLAKCCCTICHKRSYFSVSASLTASPTNTPAATRSSHIIARGLWRSHSPKAPAANATVPKVTMVTAIINAPN